jgi:hypothetical protein
MRVAPLAGFKIAAINHSAFGPRGHIRAGLASLFGYSARRPMATAVRLD